VQRRIVYFVPRGRLGAAQDSGRKKEDPPVKKKGIFDIRESGCSSKTREGPRFGWDTHEWGGAGGRVGGGGGGG